MALGQGNKLNQFQEKVNHYKTKRSKIIHSTESVLLDHITGSNRESPQHRMAKI
jgi:hypothetical protein